MTTTYSPSHPQYLVESDLREEMTRVFDLCHGCRLCFNLCPSFGSLFKMIDAHDGHVSALTTAEQDRVVDECFQCKLCYIKCPYVPPHDWQLDFPRLIMRANAIARKTGHEPLTERAADQVLARTDLIGKLSSTAAPVVNVIIGARGSIARRAMQATAGIHADRLLPPYSRERFTTWFRKRTATTIDAPRAQVSVFPTCFVEYMEPEIGKDIVVVYEHNNVSCSLPEGTKCCGAPWLHSGNVDQFAKSARRNVAALVTEVRAGRDVIVAQPTCAYVIKKDYPIYAPGEDAELVAAHTFDAAEFLMREHTTGAPLDTEFPGEVPEDVVYHLACHLRAQNIGFKSRDLMRLTGAKISLIERCSGIDGTWGYRKENYDLARKVAQPLVRDVEAAPEQGAVCGDCHLANMAILQETGRRPLHPLQYVARAYGIETSST